jgi:hypothetical protein
MANPLLGLGSTVRARERVIEIGEEPVKSTIVRNGTVVATPAVDTLKVDALIDKLIPVEPANSPRVISQSVRPGTRVPKGTAIDLVLVPPADLNIGIIAEAHLDLIARPVTAVTAVINNPVVLAILDKYDDPTKITDADKTALSQAAAPLDIAVESDPQSKRSAGALFNALKGARAFL